MRFTIIAFFLLLSSVMMAQRYVAPPFDKTKGDTTRKALLHDYVAKVDDAVIKERLKCLEQKVSLPYHPVVRKHIHRYVIKNREQVRIFIKRKKRYFPIFEEALKRHGMPDEIKYLSVVESALIPRIKSWASAAGLWQFMPATGRQFGLRQDQYIDERLDPYKSTNAACKYLKQLYNMFGDWHMALAAYNCGPGNVQRAIRRSGKTTFWGIYNYLPRETRNYVPMFITINYVLNYYDKHYIPEPDEYLEPIPSDTIMTRQYINLYAFAKKTHIPIETLQDLNPHLVKNIVPYYAKYYPLRIPKNYKNQIVAQRKSIMSASRNRYIQPVSYPKGNKVIQKIDGKIKIIHTVRKGEYISLLAKNYKVSTTDIRIWNKLRSNTIYANQKLVIWKKAPEKKKTPIKTVTFSPKTKTETKESTKVSKTEKKEEPSYHIVQSGDTVWKINQKYGTTLQQIQKLNPKLNPDVLVKGQKIRIK